MLGNWKKTKKTVEHAGDNYTSCDWSIIENGQNTEKSPGDLSRFAVTHSSEKPSANADVKSSNEWIIIIIINNKKRKSEKLST